MIRPSEHLLDGSELILSEHVFIEKVRRELDRYLSYILGSATSLLPDMLKIFTADENEFIIPYLLHTVADNPADSFAVLYEVEFKLFMLMKRIRELSLVTLDDMKTVPFGKLSDFSENFAHIFNFL